MKKYLFLIFILFIPKILNAKGIEENIYICKIEHYVSDNISIISYDDDYILNIISNPTEESLKFNGLKIKDLPKEGQDLLYPEIENLTFKVFFSGDKIMLHSKSGNKFKFKNIDYLLDYFPSNYEIKGFYNPNEDYEINWDEKLNNYKNFQHTFGKSMSDITFGTSLFFTDHSLDGLGIELRLMNINNNKFMGTNEWINGKYFSSLISKCEIDEF